MGEPTTAEGNDLVATIAYDRLERAIDERLGLIVDRIASEAIDAAMTEDLYGKLEETVRETLTTGAHKNSTGSNDDVSPIESQEKEAPDVPTLVYHDSIEWFEQYWCYVYRRETSTRSPLWCEEWWKHPEALTRIELMWRSWEAARQSDSMTGVAAWMVNIADPMMAQLLSPEGTFKGCIDAEHVDRENEELTLSFIPAPRETRTPTGATTA